MIRRLIPARISAPLQRFFALESAAGIVMLAAAIVAIFAANSPLGSAYAQLTLLPVGNWVLSEWVSEVLMVFFFFVVGLELKREMTEGFLANRAQMILPGLAALGGMVVPAALYMLINAGIPANFNGWAIPSATDIAFAVCILMLAGRGIPPSIKIFLLAIAIFDDLGAILIIAFFYSAGVNLTALALAAGGVAALCILNHFRIRWLPLYILLGVYLWFCLHEAHIHTTIAGVLVGLLVPMRDKKNKSPVERAMHLFHPWVAYLVLPLFAFTSAGVSLNGIGIDQLFAPIPLGIMLGLFFGKQIGIFGVTWLVIRAGIAKLPEDSTWKHVYGVSVIAGVGFTMSLFIGLLAFPEIMQSEVKIGVIGGSLLSTIWGAFVLKWARN